MSDNKICDGISQQMRIKAALQPDYVSVDERSMRDVFEFLLQYSKELRCFNEYDQEEGNWQDFFPKDSNEILSYIKNPALLPHDKTKECQQPHFVLLLSFLQLLELVRTHMNGLTKKHLDFYFQDVLHMQKKKAVPDKVNVLVDLAKNKEEFVLPAGTLLNAGKMLVCKTDEDVHLNRIQVVKLKSIYVEKHIEGIRTVLKSNEIKIGEDTGKIFTEEQKEKIEKKCSNEKLLELFKIAFGHPFPGDNLKEYNFNGKKILLEKLLKSLFYQLKFIKNKKSDGGLEISFSQFDRLVKLKKRQEQRKENGDWRKINSFLEKKSKESISIQDTDDDFQKNFRKSFKYSPYDKNKFKHISDDISNITDLYLMLERNGHEKYNKELEELHLKFSNEQDWEDFRNIMCVKIGIDKDWKEIDEILNIQSIELDDYPKFKDKFSRIYGKIDPDNFEENIKNYFMPIEINDIENLYISIKAVETYFFLPAYHLYLLLSACISNEDNSIDVFKIDIAKFLNAAYQKKCKEMINEKGNDIIISLKENMPENDRKYVEEKKENYDQDKTHSILMRAGRSKEGNLFGLVPTKEEWQGVYATDDARTAVVSSADAQRWKTFGQFIKKQNNGTDDRQLAEFGLAISSPVLLLSQGKRTITLTFEFACIDSNHLLGNIFCIAISKEDGWIEVSHYETDKYNKLLISISSDSGKIAAPKFGIFKNAKWPILKITFDDKNQKNNSVKFYQKLKGEYLFNINIYIKVEDLDSFTVKNDFQVLDSKKPFEIFGPKPIVGSKCYISHPDFFNKKLSSIDFKIDWANLEQLTDEYYDSYGNVIKKENFETAICCFNGIKSKYPLFGSFENKGKDVKGFHVRDIINICKEEKDIYLELEYPDFQHSLYPALAANKTIEMAAAIANKNTGASINGEYFKINPPYTPVVKKMTIDYDAIENFDEKSSETKLFHIYPFGYAEVQPVEEEDTNKKIIKKYPFLPKFDNAGELYIGLENLKPSQQPQRLNMLFQLAEGSADANLTPETVHWDYLSDNHWESLENGGMLSDGTSGLINTGIIQFSLPAASKPSTILPPELYWLRARIRRNPDSVCDIVDIHTQALSATLTDSDNVADDHFRQPLAQETIKKLIYPNPAIKAIRQPYTSFGGKGAEPDELFYTRVSERLRHKQRALTRWDYEHLVLERFPQIYKVKCIPLVFLEDNDNLGVVELIVIPDIRNRMPSDPFEPKASVELLSDIQNYLRRFAPDSANIVVKNAEYVPFEISMAVRFVEKCDEGYSKKRLNEELNRFLAPWAYAEKNSDIVIGQTIYASSIINFSERLDYIDYVAQLTFYADKEKIDSDEIKIAAKEGSVVLVPQKEHSFNAISREGYKQKTFIGINYMRIEFDFKID